MKDILENPFNAKAQNLYQEYCDAQRRPNDHPSHSSSLVYASDRNYYVVLAAYPGIRAVFRVTTLPNGDYTPKSGLSRVTTWPADITEAFS